MIPYWILFAVVAGGAVLGHRDVRSSGETRPLLVFALIFVALMIGLRFRVGGDWHNYIGTFNAIRTRDLWQALWLSTSDPAYSFLNWIAHQFGWQIWFVNLVCGALLAWGIGAIARRQPNPWLALVIAVPYLIIVVGMGYTRQAAAIGLALVGIDRLLRGSLAKFLIFIAAATLFHKTAIILLPVVGLALTRNRVTTVGLVGLTAILLFYFLLADRIDRLTTNYLEAQLQSEGAAVRVAMNAVPAVIYLVGQRRFGFNEDERLVWRNVALAAVAAAVALIFLPQSTAIDRLALYLSGIQLVVLGRLPWAYGRGGSTLLLLLGIILYSAAIQYTWLNYATHARQWLPYRNYVWA